MENKFKVFVVQLILDGKAEEALRLLAKHYNVNEPKIRVGLPKGRKRNTLGCYVAETQTIFVFNNDTLKEPFVILHEFYHHLRMGVDKSHRGTEKHEASLPKGKRTGVWITQ
ncbi:MAG: hypothetical protein QW146_07630 [Candidatus Bathyarchaeia archaeon]